MKEEYERDKVEINDLNNLIENLLKLEEEDMMEIGDDMDEYAMEVCDGSDDNDETGYSNMVAETNAEDEENSEKKPKDDDKSMKLGNDTKPNIVDTNDEESMELSDEPETNVVDNTDDERCMEITNDDGIDVIDVMPKPRNVPKGLDSKLKKKKTWTKLKSGRCRQI